MIYKSDTWLTQLEVMGIGSQIIRYKRVTGYRYYIRRFEKNSSGTKTSMTINVGKTLVNWNSTSSGLRWINS